MHRYKITFNKLNEINMTIYITAINEPEAIVKFYLIHSNACDIVKIEEVE